VHYVLICIICIIQFLRVSKMFLTKAKERVAVGALIMMASMPTWAVEAAAVADKVKGQFGAIGGMATSLFLLVGIFLVGGGLLKLKAHKDNPQQVPLSQPMTMLIVGGLLTVILGIMTIAGDSSGLKGQGAGMNESSTADGLFN